MKLFDIKLKKLFYENLSNRELSAELGCSISKIKRHLKNLGLSRNSEQIHDIMVKTGKKNISDGKIKIRYGDENPSRRPEVRAKISQSLKENSLKNKKKREATTLQRYGVKNVFESSLTQKQIKETNLLKYGATSPMKNKAIAEKAIKALNNTLHAKFEFDKRIDLLIATYNKLGRKLYPEEVYELWGINQSNTYRFIRRYKLEEYVALKESRLQSRVEQFLKDNNISYIRNCRKIISPQEIDIYIPEFKVGIEVNDIETHNSTINTFGGEPKSKDYHYNKSKICEEKGIRLIHIWSYEWLNNRQRPILESIIMGACNESINIYARKCSIVVKKSSEMREFFDRNNIQGFRGGKFAICLEYEGEIVMAYMMGYPFFGKGKYQWEVIRGATKLGYRVLGGASRIWKYFIQNYSPESIVYYIDYNYFNGNSLPFLGLNYITTQASFKNWWVKERKIKNRQPSKHSEIKELVERGLVWEVWNAGVKVYVWRKPESL